MRRPAGCRSPTTTFIRAEGRPSSVRLWCAPPTAPSPMASTRGGSPFAIGEGGIAMQPLSRVGPGLYRFALRARGGHRRTPLARRRRDRRRSHRSRATRASPGIGSFPSAPIAGSRRAPRGFTAGAASGRAAARKRGRAHRRRSCSCRARRSRSSRRYVAGARLTESAAVVSPEVPTASVNSR